MSRNILKVSLSAVAIVAASSCAFAQGATGTAGESSSMQMAPRSGNVADPNAVHHPMAGSDLTNSTNKLERGTASGQGSGPGGGTPNGN